MRHVKSILNLILILFITTTLLNGCKFFSSTKLKAPVVTLNEETTTINWDANYNASKYEIYMNESKIDDVKSDANKTQYSYNYSEVIGDFGEFRFQVKSIAKDDYVDSDLSKAVTVNIGSATAYLNKNLTETKFEYDQNFAPRNINVSNNTILWTKPNTNTNITGYVVSIFTNTGGIDNYPTTNTSLVISDLMRSGNEIMVIKVSSIIGGVNYSSKNLYYYNPIDNDKFGAYTDTIYTFDGEVYDYYIENWTELQNLYYYAFIYRIEDLDFMVSETFYEAGADTYFDTSSLSNYKADEYITGYAYYETYGFNAVPHLSTISAPSGVNEKCFNMTCRFITKEPSLTGVGASFPTYTQDERYEPYYNMVDYERRSDSFDDFASDDWFLTEEVKTSEELFWAVSSHVTPIITDTTSRAYLIYEKAKDVLREIICDDMSDYEKALSIFDYIMTTTTYDYNAFYNQGNNSPMGYSCYYLEAVFLNENKVSVCDGYSKAFAMLCNMEGINCVRVVGTAGTVSQGGHAWNKVEIDDNWYVVDITWTELEGNSDGAIHYTKSFDYFNQRYYADASLNIDEEESSHMYFLLSDSEIEDTHFAFENRFLYSIVDAPESYNFYTNTYITTDGGDEVSRLVGSVEELAVILEHCLVNDGSGAEIVITSELFTQYDNSFIDILKAARKSFCSASYYVSMVESSTIQYSASGVEINGETIHYVKGMAYAAFKYDSEGNVGLFFIVCPRVSLTTNTRFNDFIDYVVENRVDKQTDVTISKNKIDDWVKLVTGNSNISGLSDAQRIEYLEDYINSAFATGGNNINVEITRTAEDVTEEDSYTQDDNGDWGYADLTVGKYTLEFTYA